MTLLQNNCVRRTSGALGGIWVLTTLIIAGCDRGPVAPELRNSPIYRNRQEGFRFLIPDGWKQSASANLPPGNLETELFLVQYEVPSRESDAQVQIVCCQDKPGKIDLAKHHVRPAYGVKEWTLREGPTLKTVGGREGSWFYLTGRNKAGELAQEILSFRKKDRIYSFVGVFASSDQASRQAIHRAFESVIWD